MTCMSRSAVAANINSCVADYGIVPHTSFNNNNIARQENVQQDADAKKDVLTAASTLSKPTTVGTNFSSFGNAATFIFSFTTFAFIFIFRALIGRAKRKSEFGFHGIAIIGIKSRSRSRCVTIGVGDIGFDVGNNHLNIGRVAVVTRIIIGTVGEVNVHICRHRCEWMDVYRMVERVRVRGCR